MKDTSVIPKGMYCHGELIGDGNGGYYHPHLCPYWRQITGRHEQENGWCDYLRKGDYELNREDQWTEFKMVDGKRVDGDSQTAEEIGIPMSLLWDQCKECNINMDDCFEEDDIITEMLIFLLEKETK